MGAIRSLGLTITPVALVACWHLGLILGSVFPTLQGMDYGARESDSL